MPMRLPAKFPGNGRSNADSFAALTRIGDVVPFFRVTEADRLEFDEFALVVGKGFRSNFWQTVGAQSDRIIERRVDPLAILLGVDAYLHHMNTALVEIGIDDDCDEHRHASAIDAETVDSDAGTGTNDQTTTYNVTSVASQPPG